MARGRAVSGSSRLGTYFGWRPSPVAPDPITGGVVGPFLGRRVNLRADRPSLQRSFPLQTFDVVVINPEHLAQDVAVVLTQQGSAPPYSSLGL
jgi:hypothetical protein